MAFLESIVVLTHEASPYQVELFNAIARTMSSSLHAIYLYSRHSSRQWGHLELKHPHQILDDDSDRIPAAASAIAEAKLVVLNYYRHPFAAELLRTRVLQDKPWCFWGERMGVTKLGWAGAFYRRWKLKCLHKSRASIWGIGEFALERYRREFGPNHVYCNVPYFSDLSRFQTSQPRTFSSGVRRILYSGSFIERKGVDLLARAFRRVARDFPNLRLTLLGDGPLRGSLVKELAECSDRVEFVGFKDWPDLPPFYHQADVLCVPSRHDGWALVVPEGLAAGLPVIGTDRTGAALEFVKTGQNGWLIGAGREDQLAAALREAATLSPEELSKYSQAAQVSVQHHSLADGVARFQEAAQVSIESWR